MKQRVETKLGDYINSINEAFYVNGYNKEGQCEIEEEFKTRAKAEAFFSKKARENGTLDFFLMDEDGNNLRELFQSKSKKNENLKEGFVNGEGTAEHYAYEFASSMMHSNGKFNLEPARAWTMLFMKQHPDVKFDQNWKEEAFSYLEQWDAKFTLKEFLKIF